MLLGNLKFIKFLMTNSYRDKKNRLLYKTAKIKKDPIYQEILLFLDGIPMVKDLKPRELIWCLKNNYNQPPSCETCGKELTFKFETSNKNYPDGYVRKYCNLKCFNDNPTIKAEAVRREKEMAPQRLIEKEARMKEAGKTWVDMPGIDNFDKARERMKIDPEFVKQRSENTRKTNQERYGVDHLNQLPGEGKRRRVVADETCNIKYGAKNPFSLSYIQTQIQATNLEKYGYEIATKAEVVYLKIIPEHYNTEGKKLLSKEFIENNFIDEKGYLKHKEFRLFLNGSDTIPYKMCNDFGVTFKHRSGRSRAEEEIVSFIELLVTNIKIVTNSRKIISPKELDIYLPEYDLAIEYNGSIWHSHGISKHSQFNTPVVYKDRHLNKMKMCLEKSIDLIHIFEDEYIKNPDFYQDLIAWKLGVDKPPKFKSKEIHWNLNFGLPPEELQTDYVFNKLIEPRANYFKTNKFLEVSQWTQFKTEEELYEADYRKYYDCGKIILKKEEG